MKKNVQNFECIADYELAQQKRATPIQKDD